MQGKLIILLVAARHGDGLYKNVYPDISKHSMSLTTQGDSTMFTRPDGEIGRRA